MILTFAAFALHVIGQYLGYVTFSVSTARYDLSGNNPLETPETTLLPQGQAALGG